MSPLDEVKPLARSRALMSRHLGDDVVILDEEGAVVHTLTGDAAAVWRRCDGATSVPQIAQALQLPVDRVSDVVSLLVELRLAEVSSDVSRRALLKVGVIALGVGLGVATTALPAAAQAASNPGSGPTAEQQSKANQEEQSKEQAQKETQEQRQKSQEQQQKKQQHQEQQQKQQQEQDQKRQQEQDQKRQQEQRVKQQEQHQKQLQHQEQVQKEQQSKH